MDTKSPEARDLGGHGGSGTREVGSRSRSWNWGAGSWGSQGAIPHGWGSREAGGRESVEEGGHGPGVRRGQVSPSPQGRKEERRLQSGHGVLSWIRVLEHKSGRHFSGASRR